MLLISDGRPGHYRQSEGVVAALGRVAAVALTRLHLRTRLPLPKGLVPKAGRLLPPAWFLSLVHGIDPGEMERPDLIVSAGGGTLGANVALARLWGVPNVFSGSTRGFPAAAFRLILTPYASVGGTAPNVVAGPKPTPFDPGRIPDPRPLARREDMQRARVSVLVGGPTPYADFGGGDWSRLAALLAALVSGWGCRVTIVTSPRTPDEAYAHLLPLAEGSGGAVSVIDFRTAGPGSIEAAFDCELVLITSDSMSMITEAALSRRPAVALAPEKVAPNRDDEAIADLAAARRLAVLPLAATDAAALVDAALALAPMRDNHLDLLARTLANALEAASD